MIAGIYLVPILFLSILITFFLGASTYLAKPVYEATTVLVLDNSLGEILKNVKSPVPSTSSVDFIRIEYFATNTLGIMSYPEIAQAVIDKLDIKNSNDKKISPDDLLNDNFLMLSFLSPGKGVSINWVSDTQLFQINGFGRSLEEAAVLSKAYSDAFLEYNRNQFNSDLDKLTERLETDNASLFDQLSDVDNEIAKLLTDHEIFEIDAVQNELTSTIHGIEKLLADEELNEKVYATKRELFLDQMQKTKELVDYEKHIQMNPEIISLQSAIRTLLTDLSEAAVQYTPDHPAYRKIEEKLQKSRELLNEQSKTIIFQSNKRLPNAYDDLLKNLIDMTGQHLVNEIYVTHLNKIKKIFQRRLAELLEVQNQYTKLTSKKNSINSLIASNFNDILAIKSLKGKNLPGLQVVSHANPNISDTDSQIVFPKRKIAVAVIFFVSLFLLFLYIFAREILADTLYHAWQLSYKEKKKVLEYPEDFPATFNNLSLANICRHIHPVFTTAREKKLVRITGINPRCGQEAIACAFAWYLGRFGKKVVLVDCDVVNKTLTKSFGLDGRPGLLDVLRGDVGVENISHLLVNLEINIISAGTGKIDSCQLKEMANFKKLINQLSTEDIQIVILDAPITEDFLILADIYSGEQTVLTIKSGSVSVHEIESMRDDSTFAKGAINNVDDIILTSLLYDADIFSFNGYVQIATRLISVPFCYMKNRRGSRLA